MSAWPSTGDLDQRITVQSLDTSTSSGSGQPIEIWTDFATLWAKVVELSGSEMFKAEKVNAVIITNFYVRFRSDITPTMRILWDSRTWNINAPPIRDDRKFFMRIIASETK